jgi:hypothetical protein
MVRHALLCAVPEAESLPLVAMKKSVAKEERGGYKKATEHMAMANNCFT